MMKSRRLTVNEGLPKGVYKDVRELGSSGGEWKTFVVRLGFHGTTSEGTQRCRSTYYSFKELIWQSSEEEVRYSRGGVRVGIDGRDLTYQGFVLLDERKPQRWTRTPGVDSTGNGVYTTTR